MSRKIRMVAAIAAIICACAAPAAFAAAQFNINIIPGPDLAANPAALAAFNRAANDWAQWIDSPITVNINADLGPLGANVLGEASQVQLQDDYVTGLRPQMVANAVGKPAQAILNSLPATISASNVRIPGPTAALPLGFTVDPNVVFTKANAKALGYGTSAELDAQFGVSDGSITFSNSFPFDYDRTNVTPGHYDLESVAAHEIGHILGFISDVDAVDSYMALTLADGVTQTDVTSLQLTALDLFRFANITGLKPTNAAGFAAMPRSLIPGEDEIFSDTVNEHRFATGQLTGDGNQGSHWKNDNLTGVFIGLMDPSIAPNTVENITSADLQAMNAIGYDIRITAVPEPSTFVLLILSAGVMLIYARRRLPARCAIE